MHIAIAGNIGAGKTSLAELLAKHYKWEAHFEDVIDNPYLDDFYNHMERWSFNLQIYCLPQGGTPPPARPFTTAPLVKRFLFLSISAISATLICAIVLAILFLQVLGVLGVSEPLGAILEGLWPS